MVQHAKYAFTRAAWVDGEIACRRLNTRKPLACCYLSQAERRGLLRRKQSLAERGGQILCEIESNKVQETAAVFEQAGFEVERRADWFGAERMLRATLLKAP